MKKRMTFKQLLFEQQILGILLFSLLVVFLWVISSIYFSYSASTLTQDDQLDVLPLDPTINGLSHIEWTGATISPEASARNAVFYGDKAIDRSPCGTGTSARMAQWHAKGKLKQGDLFIHESIIGSQFIGRVEGITTVGSYPAIIPSVEGWARVYGHNTITIDDEDPYAFGFQVI